MSTKLKSKSLVKPQNDLYGLSWDVFRVTDERKKKLLSEFAKWVELEDSLQLMVFYQSQRITSKLWLDLVSKHEEFRELDQYGRHLIGQRREKLMWANKINPQVGLRTQRLYADDYQKIYQDNMDHQNKLASKETNIRFLPVLTPIEDTGVKPREDDLDNI